MCALAPQPLQILSTLLRVSPIPAGAVDIADGIADDTAVGGGEGVTGTCAQDSKGGSGGADCGGGDDDDDEDDDAATIDDGGSFERGRVAARFLGCVSCGERRAGDPGFDIRAAARDVGEDRRRKTSDVGVRTSARQCLQWVTRMWLVAPQATQVRDNRPAGGDGGLCVGVSPAAGLHGGGVRGGSGGGWHAALRRYLMSMVASAR